MYARVVLWLGLSTGLIPAQTAAPPKKAAPAKTTKPAAAAPAAEPSPVDSVIEMVQAGVTESLILKSLSAEGKAIPLKPADLVKLKKANVPDNIIAAMMDPSAAAPSPAAPSAPASAISATAEKRPGVKRIGVAATGQESGAIVNAVVALLRGDGSILDVISLQPQLPIYRVAEARSKQCDFILDVTVEARKAGGGFASLVDKAKAVNRESVNFGNKQPRIDETDKQGDSAARINNELGVKPKDKIRFA